MLFHTVAISADKVSSACAVQVFPASQPGVYINKLQLGSIRADLSANYDFSSADQIDVAFIDISAYLGPLRLINKVMKRNSSVICPPTLLQTLCGKWVDQCLTSRL